MRPCFGTVRTSTTLVALALAAASTAAQDLGHRGASREWPCRLVVERPLLEVVEVGWRGSETFRRQCRALAGKRAIAVIQPGAERSSYTARTRIGVAHDGTVIGRVELPLNTEALERIAHELEHILERAEGLDLSEEARRTPTGVWRTLDGFETQRAIDVGRRVAREVSERSGVSR